MAKKSSEPAARKYRVVGLVPGLIFFKGREWDLRELSEKDADYLIQNGCSYVQWEKEQDDKESTGNAMIQ